MGEVVLTGLFRVRIYVATGMPMPYGQDLAFRAHHRHWRLVTRSACEMAAIVGLDVALGGLEHSATSSVGPEFRADLDDLVTEPPATYGVDAAELVIAEVLSHLQVRRRHRRRRRRH